MAKQFGVSDAALDGLKDPGGHPFPPDQKAALLFADAMTEGRVPEPIYQELRRHFDEAAIVEIACVVGLFNYFNRFNNALHVEITLTDPDALVRCVEEAIASGSASELSGRVAEILRQGRRYSRVEIGAAPAARKTPAGQPPEFSVPFQRGGVANVIVVESDRDLDEEDRALIERVALLLGRG